MKTIGTNNSTPAAVILTVEHVKSLTKVHPVLSSKSAAAIEPLFPLTNHGTRRNAATVQSRIQMASAEHLFTLYIIILFLNYCSSKCELSLFKEKHSF